MSLRSAPRLVRILIRRATTEELIFRSRKPIYLLWYFLLFFYILTLCSHAHKTLFLNNNPEDVHTVFPPRPEGWQAPIKLPPPPTTPAASLQNTLASLPDITPPPAQGGIILFQHVVKTGGTTIRDNFGNRTLFDDKVDYKPILNKASFHKLQTNLESILTGEKQLDGKTIFVEIHGRNTPTLVELAPILTDWKQKARARKIPFFSFTLLRDPVEFAVSFFSHFHVFGDARFGPNMEGTVENLKNHLQHNPQCLYLYKGEQAYFRRHKFYNVTRQDCQQVQTLLHQVMDWVGDTKNLSKDTLPLLTWWITGNAGLASQLESSNVAGKRQQKYQPLSKRNVDEDTRELIRSYSMLDEGLYQSAVITEKLKEAAGIIQQKG